MKKIKNNKFLVAVSMIFLFAASFFVSQAGISENVTGWLWDGTDDGTGPTMSTGLGWISTNNTNTCDKDENAYKDVDCGGDNSTTLAISYGVNMPDADGSVTGYAWSENVGWINFNGVSRSGDNLIGWARISGIETESAANNSGGWQGWISLNSLNCDPDGNGQSNGGVSGSITCPAAGTLMASYGATIDTINNTIDGYGWSDELGWVSLRANIDAPAACVCDPTENASNCGPYINACGTTCIGTNCPACVPDPSCADDTCEGDTCDPGCSDPWVPGNKKCPDLNWKEVQP